MSFVLYPRKELFAFTGSTVLPPSVLNVIGVYELYFATKSAAGIYYRYFESYIICAIFYFVICYIFTKILNVVEKKVFKQKDYELAVEYMSGEAE